MATFEDYNNLFRYMGGDQKITNIECIISDLKEHIINNPDDSISIGIKDWIFYNIQDEFLNSDLEKAFNMNNNYIFSKKLEIYNHMPFVHSFSEFRYYFYGLIQTSNKYKGKPKNFYIACKDFCENYKPGEIPSELFDKVIQYCKYNKVIMNNAFDKYNIRSPKNTKNNQGEELGVIGEEYIYDILKEQGLTTYLDNNGFGFDILFVNFNNFEYLIEVKTTDRNKDTYFEISEHEKKVLFYSTNLPQVEYVIARVFVNKNNKTCTHTILHYDRDNNAFYNNDDPTNPITYYGSKEEPLKFAKKTNRLILNNKLKNEN